MKTRNYLFIFTMCVAFLGFSSAINAQCTDYLAPTSAGYTNFNTSFGGAPCDDGSGCPVDQIVTFEVYASESYAVDNFIAGGMYEFNICDGPGAGSWIPEFTIIAPSGAIDAFGSGTDSCRISWTASESGTYQILINEAGACGGGQNTAVDNGYPTLTCLGNAVCPDECTTWYSPEAGVGFTSFNTAFDGAPCDSGDGCVVNEITDFEVWAAEAYAMANIQADGQYRFSTCNGPGAGTWVPDFTIISPSGNIDAFGLAQDSCSITWTASESGEYIIVVNEAGECGGGPNREVNNGFPAITCLGGTMCDTTVMMMDTCTAGMVISDLENVICGDFDSLVIVLEGVAVPDSGGLGYNFVPGEGASGGLDGGFFISNGNPNPTWNNDINGVLSANGLAPLGGQWFISPFTYALSDSIVETVCEFADETVGAYFNAEMSAEAQDIGGGQATVTVTGGTEPYSYNWSDSGAQSTDTLDVDTDGEYSVVVTDAVGCTTMASVMIMSTSVSNLPGATDLTIAPNPSNGQLFVRLQLEVENSANVQIIDVNGRVLTQQQLVSTHGDINFDLSEYANGIYMVRVTVGNASTVRKVMLAK